MMDAAAARRLMIDSQLRTFDVQDQDVLAAFDAVAREPFLFVQDRPLAYTDARLACGATGERALLVPMILARMLQHAEIRASENALVVAGGTGYSAAILARMGARVTLLEDAPALADNARSALAGVADVPVVIGALPQGWAQGAPYSLILVEGAISARPETLLAQLGEGGRLLAILREGRRDRATLFLRAGGTVSARAVFEASAAPLPAFDPEPGFVF